MNLTFTPICPECKSVLLISQVENRIDTTNIPLKCSNPDCGASYDLEIQLHRKIEYVNVEIKVDFNG